MPNCFILFFFFFLIKKKIENQYLLVPASIESNDELVLSGLGSPISSFLSCLINEVCTSCSSIPRERALLKEARGPLLLSANF